jgi:SPP1 family predicted phage head-tail adaptor
VEPVKAGDLRHRVEIQSSTAARGQSGATLPAWNTSVPFAYARAKIEPLSAREVFAAEAASAEVTHRITIRYLAGLKTDMRIKHGTRYFDVVGIRNIEERNAWLELLCVEGRTAGA